jgi:hypothetical protein
MVSHISFGTNWEKSVLIFYLLAGFSELFGSLVPNGKNNVIVIVY